ncbi:hypothetical protein D3C87_1171270 [compost metagenome]
MGDAAGELADGFHFLRLAQRFLVVTQLRGALLHLLFKGFEGVLQAQFALAQVDQPIPGFVLSSPPAQGRGDQADQCDRVKWPFEEGHVAQLRAEARCRVLLRAAMVCHQHDRQIRPRGLLFDQADQRFQISAQQRLARDQQQAGTLFQFGAQSGQVGADHPVKPGLVEHHQGYLAVAPSRRKDDCALGRRLHVRHGISSASNGLLAPRYVGTPRNTP